MKKKVFGFLMVDAAKEAVKKIAENFPCFIWEEKSLFAPEMEYIEITIEAREEDWPAIEKILAPVV